MMEQLTNEQIDYVLGQNGGDSAGLLIQVCAQAKVNGAFVVAFNAVLEAARNLSDTLNGGFVRCRRCGDQEDTTDLDFAPELRAAIATYDRAKANIGAEPKPDPILTRLDLIGELTSPEYISRLRGVRGRGEVVCRHEPFEGRCVHCDVKFVAGKPIASPVAGEVKG